MCSMQQHGMCMCARIANPWAEIATPTLLYVLRTILAMLLDAVSIIRYMHLCQPALKLSEKKGPRHSTIKQDHAISCFQHAGVERNAL